MNQYPPTFEEQNLAGDIHIRPEDIADYAYASGERKRYTAAGWLKAQEIGIAVILGLAVDPALDFHDVGCVKRYGAVPDNAAKCQCEKRRDAIGELPKPSA